MRMFALLLLVFFFPIAVFSYKVSEQAGYESGRNYSPKIQVDRPPLSHPPKVFSQSVVKAKKYWAERDVKVPCETIQAYVLASVPTQAAADAGAEANDCRIFMRREWYVQVVSNHQDHFCAIIFHEIGHIAGIGHDPNPNSLMHAGLRVIPKECQ